MCQGWLCCIIFCSTKQSVWSQTLQFVSSHTTAVPTNLLNCLFQHCNLHTSFVQLQQEQTFIKPNKKLCKIKTMLNVWYDKQIHPTSYPFIIQWIIVCLQMHQKQPQLRVQSKLSSLLTFIDKQNKYCFKQTALQLLGWTVSFIQYQAGYWAS